MDLDLGSIIVTLDYFIRKIMSLLDELMGMLGIEMPETPETPDTPEIVE